MGQMLLALNFQLGPTYEIVLTGDSRGDGTRAALRDLYRRYLPNKVLAAAFVDKKASPPSLLNDLLAGKAPTHEPVLYICEGFACQEPAQGAAAISNALDKLTRQV
jgi:uncharacterized protein YyaL (SSP411 family)